MLRFHTFFFILVIVFCSIVSAQDLPGTVAIMPFINETEETDIAIQIRRSFYNHFSSKPYRDVELGSVDEKTIQLEKKTGKNIHQIDPQEISASIGCDGIIYGKVTNFTKAFAALYSQLSVEAEVWMINTKTKKEIFRIKDSVTYHGGSVPTSPLGIIMTAISAAMNMRDIQQVRLINELCYKLNQQIPSPEGMVLQKMPVIKEVLTNVKESPFSKGKVITVGIEGDKDLVATFDIGNFRKGIPMKETNPGIYVGEYLVLPGDNVKDMPIIVSLKRPEGGENQWIDVNGLVTIDTTPPPQVTGIKAKGFPDRIEIIWTALTGVPDLKGYRILRSEQPLTGFKETAALEMNTYEDKAVKPGITYYYRVTAFDALNNESEQQDSVKTSLVSAEPVMLTGELKKDTILSGSYIVAGEFIVPKNLSLTVEDGTKIAFQEMASFVIFGKLILDGKEIPVEFVSTGETKWKGIVAEGGIVSINRVRIKGALSAFSAINTQGVIRDSVVTGNEAGVSISGNPAIMLEKSAISGNKTGVTLEKTDAKVIANNIFQNTEGVVLRGFSGQLKDNNIYDNKKNIFSESATALDTNYLGSVNVDEMNTEGITLKKVYDDKFPQGKPVDPVSNPYSLMSAEERTKKASELASEAKGYFRQRNFGKASVLFEESMKASETGECYYYLALCYQEIKEDNKALAILKKGADKFPRDSSLKRALGFLFYQSGDEGEALKTFKEVLRLNPEDKQVKFILERMEKK
jgi:hypothetical protein